MLSVILKDIEIKAVFSEDTLIRNSVESITITSIIETAVRGEGMKPWGNEWDAMFKASDNDYDFEYRPIDSEDVKTDTDYAMEFDNIYLS